MKLTDRASNYLKKLDRDIEWVTNEKETRDYLSNLNISCHDQFVYTQIKYSGYKLKVHQTERYNTRLNFISKFHIKKNEKLYVERIDEEVILKFDNEEKSSFYFITSKGAICSKDIDNPRKIHFTYDSIETKIEQYALLDEYYYLTTFCSEYNIDVLDFEKLKIELSNFDFVPECSDSVNYCCKNDQVIIIVSPWLEGEGKYINVYAINNGAWKKIINKLQKKKLVE